MGSFINDNILKEKYFLIARIVIMLLLGLYGIDGIDDKTGVSAEILLLVALYISVICLKEFTEGKKVLIFIAAAAAAYIALLYFGGISFSFMGVFLYYELLLYLKANRFWYYPIYLYREVPACKINRGGTYGSCNRAYHTHIYAYFLCAA